jgi:hypothetical protein
MQSEDAILRVAALAQSTWLDVFRLLVSHESKGLAAGDIARGIAVPQNTMSAHLLEIRSVDLPGFVSAELCGAIAAMLLMKWLFRAEGEGAAIAREVRP